MEDIIKGLNNRCYMEYLHDIDLANNAMSECMLSVPEKGLICDIYAIPSHNYQTYYAKIYRDDAGYKILYAKPIIHDCVYGKDIFMYPFRDSVQAKNGEGKIVCGIKTLDADFVNSLITKFECLPDKYICGSDQIVLDGVFQAIRVYENDKLIKEVVYRNPEHIPFGGCVDLMELKWFYSALHFMIEQQIGRGASGDASACDCAQYTVGSELKEMRMYLTHYREVPLGSVYKCPYCKALWSKYRPGGGWWSYFRETEDEKFEEEAALNACRIDVDAAKLQPLKESIVKMLQHIPNYSTGDLVLVDQYFAEVNGKDCVNSVYVEEDGTYTLFLAVNGKIRAKMCGKSLDEATMSIGNTIIDMIYR